MRILSFGHIPTWAGGRQNTGAANVIYLLALNMAKKKQSNVVLAATDSFIKERKTDSLIIAGWNKQILLFHMFLHFVSAISNFVRLYKLKKEYPINEPLYRLFVKRLFLDLTIKRYKPDVVHFHMQEVFFIDIVPRHCKIIVTCHGQAGTDINIAQHKILYKMEYYIFHSDRINGIFFVSKKILQDFKATYGENNDNHNYVIANSFDNTAFYYIDSTKKDSILTLCTIASLNDLKGQLRVLKGITGASPTKIRYFCIGYATENIIRELKLYASSNKIDFEYIGTLPPSKIRQYLSKADYMIMPSSSEGFGLTYLESIACGTPVILPRDLPIVQEKNLINNKNSILLDDCSAESITKMLKEIDQYHFERKEVARSVESQSWENVACKYLEIIKSIIS